MTGPADEELLLLSTSASSTADVLEAMARRYGHRVEVLGPGSIEVRGEQLGELLVLVRAALTPDEAADVRCVRSRSDVPPRTLLAQAMAAVPLDELVASPHADSATGLPSRWELLQFLDGAVQTSSTNGRTVAVLLLALQGTDEAPVLAEAATRCRGVLRGRDLLAWHDQAELCAVLTDVGPADLERIALRVAEDLLGALARPVVVDGRARHLSAHVGVALFPAHGWTGADLLDAGDAALHAARAAGTSIALAPG